MSLAFSVCLAIFYLHSFLLFIFSDSLYLFHLHSFLLFVFPASLCPLLFLVQSPLLCLSLSPTFHSYALLLFSLCFSLCHIFISMPTALSIVILFILSYTCLQIVHAQHVCVGGVQPSSPFCSYCRSSIFFKVAKWAWLECPPPPPPLHTHTLEFSFLHPCGVIYIKLFSWNS